jgi:hypothetical protein
MLEHHALLFWLINICWVNLSVATTIFTGNADGLGNIRKEELYKACATLKVLRSALLHSTPWRASSCSGPDSASIIADSSWASWSLGPSKATGYLFCTHFPQFRYYSKHMVKYPTHILGWISREVGSWTVSRTYHGADPTMGCRHCNGFNSVLTWI